MKRLGESQRDNEYPRLVFGGCPAWPCGTFQTNSPSSTSRTATDTSSSISRWVFHRVSATVRWSSG